MLAGRETLGVMSTGSGYDEDAMVVLFDELGSKTLALEVVRERGLLGPA